MESLGFRTSLSLTHITYAEDDLMGLFLALASLVPFGVFLMETTFVLSSSMAGNKRKVALLILIGQLLNEGISTLMKGLFKELRPPGTERTDYGMPSSHSQFMGFLTAISDFFIQFTIFRNFPSFVVKAVFPVAAWIVGFSRIYLGYHDIRQVAVGFFSGVTFGIAWKRILQLASVNSKKESSL